MIYGADPALPDATERAQTPADYAREYGHADLAARLVELEYEVTDAFSFHLLSRIPDHRHALLSNLALFYSCLKGRPASAYSGGGA